ncbi:MAG: twin-arginine translocase TatA/TatE family subunit [Fibrobacter sp.]|jgi:sec-independent protein translocase protein TatA|nr:twin-arginine translocase TatA/TatE family subunit [Fibrobacter sp.]
MSLGIPEIILIVVVVLLLFGAKRIPELARSLGKAQNEYKKAKEALKEEAEDLQKTVEKAADASARSATEEEKKG